MKKVIAVILSALMLAALFAGCSSENNDSENAKLSIVVTTFPQYDWVREILGDKINEVDLTLLLDNGVDLHSFQPTADDIIKISGCDLFIYVGGESDSWVEDALKQTANEKLSTVNLMDALGDFVKEEEIKEGMESEEEDDGEDELEYDEHIWLSLKNAKILCGVIADKLSEINSADADVYKSNADIYIDRLNTLDNEYEKAVSESETKTLLFADRFPFRYLADDYSLEYYAAFVGCSAETEASFETIKFLAGKVDELGLTSVLKIDNSDGKIAQTVIDSTKNKNQSIISLNSMQAVTLNDVQNGAKYIDIMEQNLNALKTALN